MQRFSAFLLLLGLLATAGFAQKAQNPTQALHYIKLANTLRALDKPEDALALLERALPAVRSKDAYLTAVTYELLGLASHEAGNAVDADYYLQIARSRYAKLKYVASAWAVNELIRDISEKNLYAGIQIGATDIKLAIFKTRYESEFYEKDIKSTFAVPNTTLFADASNAFRVEQEVLKTCLDTIQRYKIPNERIFIVFSSDVKEGLSKMPVNQRNLYKQLERALPNGALRIDTTLTANREAELFTIGAIPRKVWPTTSALDLGSNSTTGGYFDVDLNGNPINPDRSFHGVSVPVGVQTLIGQIEKKNNMSVAAFRREAQQVIPAIATTELKPLLNAGQGLQQRRTVGLGGDIAWAIVTYLHPEKADVTAVAITPQDMDQFKRLVLNDYQALTRPDLTYLVDPATRSKAERDIRAVQNRLSEKQLIAGALWLDAIMKLYAESSTPKRFVFIRNSDIGWITGKFLETINYEYESTIAKGALYTR